MKRKVVPHLIHTLPGILIYFLLPHTFVHGVELLELSQKVCAVYIVAALAFALNGLLLVFLDFHNQKDNSKALFRYCRYCYSLWRLSLPFLFL